MTALTDTDVQALLSAPNCAVLSTQNGNGSILSTVVWIAYEDGELFVNSSVGRRWPTNLGHDQHATVVVMNPENPFSFLEVRGTVTSSVERGLDDINRLSHKYLGRDYPWLKDGEQRITFVLEPTRVRFVKQ